MFESAKPFLLSLALGLMLGLERERSFGGRGSHPAIGARTFTLLALLGTLAARIGNPGVGVALAVFVALITVSAYLRPAEGGTHDLGTTTEVAAMITFAVGWLAQQEPRLAAMVGVLVLGVLWLKPKIHAFAHEGLSDQEVGAALAFLVISLVVLPLLPDRTVDPWGIVNPSRLWLMFVLIAGVGFAGYIAVRALGPTHGLAAAGFFAGLVSSTAATLSLSRRARTEQEVVGPLATGIVLANVASACAQLLILAVANAALFPTGLVLLGAPVAAGVLGALGALWWLKRNRTEVTGAEFRLSNPLELKPALAMAGMFAVILIVSAAAQRSFGESGVLVAAAVAGINDVHAATLAAATLSAAGRIGSEEAARAILVSFLVNMVVKMAIAGVAGGRRLFVIVLPPLLAMTLAAVASFSYLHQRF